MARLQRIFETINSKLPSYNSAFTKLRGLAIPTDPILGGNLRFAKKIGYPIPIWLPDNLTTTSNSQTIVDNFLYLSSPLNWSIPGSIVRISSRFLMYVDDIVEDGYRLNFTELLKVNVDGGSTVELFAVPVQVNGDYPALTDTVVINSPYKIYVGDFIVYGSFEYEVISLIFVGILPNGDYEYQVVLSQPIPDALTDGSITQLYLRSYPAYESGKIVIPTIPNVSIATNDVGPFLYDRISGVFYTDDDVEETDNIVLYDQTQTVIDTINNCGKNYLIYKKSIAADAFLFCDLLRGHLNWDKSTSTFMAITDDEGVFHLHYKCVPIINPGQVTSWVVKVTPTIKTTMAVELEPNVSQVWDLVGGVENTINIQFPVMSDPIEHIHILFSTGGNSTIYMNKWDITTSQVKYFSYQTIVKAVGETWASSPALVKPCFLKLGYVEVNDELQSHLNSGLIIS